MSQEDYKKRIENAIRANYERYEPKEQSPTRRNKKPEKEVEKQCLELMRSWNWSVEIYEAKATYDPRTQCFRQQAMKAGTCDCMGATNEGIAVAIEFKAPGAIRSFNSEKRYAQREFIKSRIQTGAFAAVVDSAHKLKTIFEVWYEIRKSNVQKAKEYLFDQLPQPRSKNSDKLFEE